MTLAAKNLVFLDLRGNNLNIPPEILSRTDSPFTIINAYLQVWKKPINEAKILLVGQGGVGKTSLVKRLIDHSFDHEEDPTQGINIRDWSVEIESQNIKLNIWDFGGQEMMHATHQFFLTKRSLYLLVLDARLGEVANRIEYWLKIIQNYGGNSPIIIVVNKIDQYLMQLDTRGLKGKYRNLKEIIPTSCARNLGIDDLRTKIFEQISQLEHIHDPVPLSWLAVKKHLEEITQDLFSYEQYQNKCIEQGITDKGSQKDLINFLHDLGVVLNFRKPRLENLNIVNPNWVTDAVYKIITDNLLMTQYGGILEVSELNRILNTEKYPPTKQLYIIDLMKEFELCFDIEPDQRFLIPDLLPRAGKELFTEDWEDSFNFQYHYDVLPTSIISRFIVRMHRMSKDLWREGVLLINDDIKAVVKTNKDKQPEKEADKIIISVKSVKGKEQACRTLLKDIRKNLESIHESFPGIKVKRVVPLIPSMIPPKKRRKIPFSETNSEIVLDYQDLVMLRKMGETEKPIPEWGIKVSIAKLLGNIDERDGIDWSLIWSNLVQVAPFITAIGGLLTGLAALLALFLKTSPNPPKPSSPTPTSPPTSSPSPTQTPNTKSNKAPISSLSPSPTPPTTKP